MAVEDSLKRKSVRKVDLGERGYEIHTGFNILEDLGPILRDITESDRVVIISNHKIGESHGDTIMDSLSGADFTPEILNIPPGEPFKSMDTLYSIYNFLVDYHHTRKSMIIAMGGGVVGDIAGYAAATFMRGIDYIHVPTSLLAMVDSSIGGKTGINHPKGKNLIGAFHQPKLVFADTATLGTLPTDEFRAGFAEVVKYGVIRSGSLFNFLVKNLELIFDLDVLCVSEIVRQSVEIKADVVENDEREAGLRMILNYGHTFGHALEAITKYETYKHGEAISIGMVAANRLAVLLGMMDEAEADAIEDLFKMAKLPTRYLSSVDPDDIVDRMKRDKKAVGNRMRFVLPSKIGEVEVVDTVRRDQLIEILEPLREK